MFEVGFFTAFADEIIFDYFDSNLWPPDTLKELDMPGAPYLFLLA